MSTLPQRVMRSRRVRAWGRGGAVAVNRAAEALGVHIVPRRFYSSEPDRRWLRANPDSWQHPLRLPGLQWDTEAQLDWLRGVTEAHLSEVTGFVRYQELTDAAFGPGYGPLEAQVLHCFVRARAPARIVEIGAGVSTAIMAEAAERNAREGRPRTHITSIDPYPTTHVEALDVELHTAPLQAVEPSLFSELGAGDLLFIDSSHAVKAGSELAGLYLDIVPTLAAGVTVHIHDLFLPYPYMPTLFDQLWDWQESVLVGALLTGNPTLQVACAMYALHADHSEDLLAVLPDYRPAPTTRGLVEDPGDRHLPSSLWLEVVDREAAAQASVAQ